MTPAERLAIYLEVAARLRATGERGSEVAALLVEQLALELDDGDPGFCPAGRLICRGCGWNADGGPCANCGTTAPDRDFEVQHWREEWGLS
jgi:hypothetical protein